MQLDRAKIRKVFVRAPNWLGDVIMATPAFARIRSFLIDAEIVLGHRKGHDRILAGSKSFDRMIVMDKANGIRGVHRQATLLRREKFDAAIVFPNSFRTALVCALARIPIRIGYAQGRGMLITHGIRAAGHAKPFWRRRGPRRTPVPMADYYGALLDHLGMPQIGPRPILRVTESEANRISEVFAQHGLGSEHELILFSPTASFGSSKLWQIDRWAEVARALVDSEGNRRVLILCGPGEEDVATDIARRADSPAVRAAVPFVPLDLLKPLVQRASLMLTTDSGPRHVAVAFEVPHVVLMGPTHPDYTSRNLEQARVLRHDVDCGPCHLPVCPVDHRCMKLIEPDEVIRASFELLSSE